MPDPLGPAILTFPDSFSPYLAMSDLNDADVWPELSIVRSPEPVAPARPDRRPGAAGLKHNQTIVGSKMRFGAGMRVDGRTRSWAGRKGLAETAPTPESLDEEPRDAKGKGRADEDEADSDGENSDPTARKLHNNRSILSTSK